MTALFFISSSLALKIHHQQIQRFHRSNAERWNDEK
jgi:hypothetical protein